MRLWMLLVLPACSFEAVSVDGKPPPCLEGFVEVGGRCVAGSVDGSTDAAGDVMFEDIGVLDAPTDTSTDAGRDSGMGMSG